MDIKQQTKSIYIFAFTNDAKYGKTTFLKVPKTVKTVKKCNKKTITV